VGWSALLWDIDLHGEVTGGIHTTEARFVRLCKTEVSRDGVHVSRSTGALIVGDPANGCDGSRIAGVVLDGNTAGVTMAGNRITGNASVTGNSGEPMIVAGNTVGQGSLACAANSPAPGDAGQPSTATGGKTGQCDTPATNAPTTPSTTSTTPSVASTSTTAPRSTSSTTTAPATSTTVASELAVRCAALRQSLAGAPESLRDQVLSASRCPPPR